MLRKHLSRLFVAAGLGAMAVVSVQPTVAEEKVKLAAMGTIERLDPAFDDLVGKDQYIEVLVSNKFDWSEGPVWDKSHSRVLFSDIPKNMIWEFSAEGGLKSFLKPSGYTGKAPFTGKEPGSNGLAINKAGELILCMHGDRRVAKWKDGKFETLVDKFEGKRFNSPNDLTIHSNGSIYFTDPPYGLPKIEKDPAKELDFQGIYRLTPKGELTLLSKVMTRPNGITLSPDEKTLYVANSDPDQANWMSFPVKEDGTLGEGKEFFDSTKAVKEGKKGLPDGLKTDKKGNIWATGPGGVYVFSPAGKHLGTLATGVPTANCGWGDDGSTLYITADKSLVRVRTKVKGW